jgi:hypothetical protein
MTTPPPRPPDKPDPASKPDPDPPAPEAPLSWGFRLVLFIWVSCFILLFLYEILTGLFRYLTKVR